MALINHGYLSHQNKRINQTAGFRQKNHADDSTTKLLPNR